MDETRQFRWSIRATGRTARLRALSAVSAEIVWVAGADGAVLRTGDSGRSWSSVDPPNAGGLQFRCIHAFDADHVVVLSFGAGAAARVLVTNDAGRSWRESYRNDDPAAFFDCLAFADADHGLALADPVDGRFRLLVTEDGGRSWRCPVVDLPPALEAEAAFAASGTCLVASDGAYWFATGRGTRARVFRSLDRGRRWTVADTPVRAAPDAGIFALAFRDRQRGIAVGGDYDDQSRPGELLAVTADGGDRWQLVERGGPPQFRSGAAWTGHGYVVVGPGGCEASRDGFVWSPLGEDGFDTVAVASDGSCWAAGTLGRVALLLR